MPLVDLGPDSATENGYRAMRIAPRTLSPLQTIGAGLRAAFLDEG